MTVTCPSCKGGTFAFVYHVFDKYTDSNTIRCTNCKLLFKVILDWSVAKGTKYEQSIQLSF